MLKQSIVFTCAVSFVLVVAALFPPVPACAAQVLCLAEDGDTIALRRKRVCTRKGGTVLNSMTVLQGPAGPQGPQGMPGPSGSSAVLCFARIASNGVVASFGGQGTTAVTGANLSAGRYRITCNGSYSGLSSGDDVIVVATAHTSLFNMGTNPVIGADENSISMTIYSRNVDTNDLVNSGFSMVVFAETR